MIKIFIKWIYELIIMLLSLVPILLILWLFFQEIIYSYNHFSWKKILIENNNF